MKIITLETLDFYSKGEYLCTFGCLSVQKLPHLSSELDVSLKRVMEDINKQKETDR